MCKFHVCAFGSISNPICAIPCKHSDQFAPSPSPVRPTRAHLTWHLKVYVEVVPKTRIEIFTFTYKRKVYDESSAKSVLVTETIKVPVKFHFLEVHLIFFVFFWDPSRVELSELSLSILI